MRTDRQPSIFTPTAQLRNLLEKSKNNEAILIDELAALREEYLANSLVDEHSEDSMTEQVHDNTVMLLGDSLISSNCLKDFIIRNFWDV